MTDLVTYRSRARIDLLEQFVHLGQEASLDTASRYLAAVEATCALLCTQPRMGTTWPSTLGQVSEMRRFPVRGFNNYLIFYLHTAEGIDIVRVLHAARDIDAILISEENDASC